MEKDIAFRQVILVTDGESNIGMDPIMVAKEAKEKGITISTIGIVNGIDKESPISEIQQIARAGGGLYEVTDMKNLSSTLSMVTMKSVYRTIEQAVSKELKETLGTSLEDIHPDSRKKVTDVIDKLGEEITLKCCIALDCSGSMANKINIAKNSVISSISILKSRKGKTEAAIIGFPGEIGQHHKLICRFTEDIEELENSVKRITTGGTTPTGPALRAAVDLLLDEKNIVTDIENNEEDVLLETNIV